MQSREYKNAGFSSSRTAKIGGKYFAKRAKKCWAQFRYTARINFGPGNFQGFARFFFELKKFANGEAGLINLANSVCQYGNSSILIRILTKIIYCEGVTPGVLYCGRALSGRGTPSPKPTGH
jgi:hypothetical protein